MKFCFMVIKLVQWQGEFLHNSCSQVYMNWTHTVQLNLRGVRFISLFLRSTKKDPLGAGRSERVEYTNKKV